MTLTIKELKSIDYAEVWPLYFERFSELNKRTIQRHLMTIQEFATIMNDRSVLKYLAYNSDNELVGLAAYTNNLSSVPLISVEYFAHNFPQLYAENRIWYCLFVTTKINTVGAFIELVRTMYHKAQKTQSIICLDVCHFNETQHQLPQSILKILKRLNPELGWMVADKQSYFVYTT